MIHNISIQGYVSLSIPITAIWSFLLSFLIILLSAESIVLAFSPKKQYLVFWLGLFYGLLISILENSIPFFILFKIFTLPF